MEIVEEAVVAARENAKQNGLENCEFIAGDVLKVLMKSKKNRTLSFSTLQGMAYIPKHFPESSVMGWRSWYTFPANRRAFARDLEIFIANGYEVQRCVPVDQFPWTTGIETVCLLVLRNPVTHINIDVEEMM